MTDITPANDDGLLGEPYVDIWVRWPESDNDIANDTFAVAGCFNGISGPDVLGVYDSFEEDPQACFEWLENDLKAEDRPKPGECWIASCSVSFEAAHDGYPDAFSFNAFSWRKDNEAEA